MKGMVPQQITLKVHKFQSFVDGLISSEP